ncbi:MAG: gliding motility-associated C-terminal domain-containing protein [Bacteroidia bacterium]|nr:gliding motility-associated C-terminal domain-containing protein [Bacteroidia bacterium]
MSGSGAIITDQVDAKSYTLTYTIGAGCGSATNQVITIDTTIKRVLSYPTPLCKSVDWQYPTVDGSPAGGGGFPGTFTFLGASTLTNAFSMLNATHGGVDPDDSATSIGTYDIYYNPSNLCDVGDTAAVKIVALPNPSFSYGPTDSFCFNLNTINLFAPMNPAGTFSSGFIPINPSTGKLTIGALSAGGVDTIKYVLSDTLCTDSSSLEITIMPYDDADFAYYQDSFCQDIGLILPDTINVPTGVFTQVTANNLVITNSSSGQIDVTTSGRGVHIIEYTVSDYCPHSTRDTITVVRLDSANFSYPGGAIPTYCETASMKFPSNTGLGGGYYQQTAGPASGLLVDSLTGIVHPWGSTPGAYTVTYFTQTSNFSHCPNTSSATLNIQAQDSAAVTYSQPWYCNNGSTGNPIKTSSGTFSEPTGTVVFNSSTTGNINLANTQPGGPYLIVYITNATSCPDTATAIVQVISQDGASMTYPDNGKYCEKDPYPTPVITGTTGGTFTSGDPVNFPVNSITGEITLDLNSLVNPDTFTVDYATASSCPTSDQVTIIVLPQEDAEFTYLTSYCESDLSATPTSIAPTSALNPYIHCYKPSSLSPCDSLVIDSVTGTIYPYLSAPGTYTLERYVPSNGIGCDAVHYEDITIIDENTARIKFLRDEYCQNSPDDKPIVLGGDSTGTFDFVYLDSVGNPVIAWVSTFAGLINFDNSGPGLFEIVYSVPGQCKNEARDTIRIYGNDSSLFFYDSNNYCEGAANPSPIILGDTVGIFSEPSGKVIFVDDSTGTIDLQKSFYGGPYFITYTTFGRCPEPYTQQVRINRQPTPVMTADPGNVICAGDPILYKVNGGFTGPSINFSFYLNDSLVITSNSNRFDPLVDMTPPYTLQDGDEIKTMAKFVPQSGGCAAYDSIQMVVNPIPSVVLNNPITTVTGDDPVSIQLFSDADSTVFYWLMTSVGRVVPEEIEDSTDFVMNGDWIYLNPTIILLDDITPAQLTFQVLPIAKGCVGTNVTIIVNVNPNDQPIFIPGVITPNGDGRNDFWNIQFEQGLVPEDFALQLYNRSGGLVDEIESLSNPMTYTGEHLPDGVYWYIITEKATSTVWAKGGLTIRRKK